MSYDDSGVTFDQSGTNQAEAPRRGPKWLLFLVCVFLIFLMLRTNANRRAQQPAEVPAPRPASNGEISERPVPPPGGRAESRDWSLEEVDVKQAPTTREDATLKPSPPTGDTSVKSSTTRSEKGDWSIEEVNPKQNGSGARESNDGGDDASPAATNKSADDKSADEESGGKESEDKEDWTIEEVK